MQKATVGYLFYVTEVIDKMSAFDRKVHFLFVDLKKAVEILGGIKYDKSDY